MKRRFSSEELFILRNDIPIDVLIEKELMIPIRSDLTVFRFACPWCSKFNTGLLREKNLVRCFDCNENFNTIEIVMESRKTDFVESVKHLKRYHKTIAEKKVRRPDQDPDKLLADKSTEGNIPGKFSKKGDLSLRNIGWRPREKGCGRPVRIGEILSTILPDPPSDPRPEYSEPVKVSSNIELSRKVVDLEAKLDCILDKLEKIEVIINSR